MMATFCNPSEATLGRYPLPTGVVDCHKMVISAAWAPLASSSVHRLIVIEAFFMRFSSIGVRVDPERSHPVERAKRGKTGMSVEENLPEYLRKCFDLVDPRRM